MYDLTNPKINLSNIVIYSTVLYIAGPEKKLTKFGFEPLCVH